METSWIILNFFEELYNEWKQNFSCINTKLTHKLIDNILIWPVVLVCFDVFSYFKSHLSFHSSLLVSELPFENHLQLHWFATVQTVGEFVLAKLVLLHLFIEILKNWLFWCHPQRAMIWSMSQLQLDQETWILHSDFLLIFHRIYSASTLASQ